MRKKYDFVKEAEKVVKQIRKITDFVPETALVLGSGWGGIVDIVENQIVIPYSRLKGLPTCTVAGHGGNFIMGNVAEKNVIIMQGRFHLYEGYPAQMLGVAIATMNLLGAQKILITNASGSVNETYKVGNVMIMRDHIDFTCQSPLVGVLPSEKRPIFIDMSEPYSKRGIEVAKKCAEKTKTDIQVGVHAQKLGPSFETASEIKMLRTLGADTVCMSSVVDNVVARYLGMEVVGFSLVTNLGTGLSNNDITHEEVGLIAHENMDKLKRFLFEVVKNF